MTALVAIIMVTMTFLNKRVDQPFTKSHALSEIRQGYVRLITFGLGGTTAETNRVAAKYGFKEVGFGCIVGLSKDEEEYDKLVNEYLVKRNGKGWRERYSMEVDSVMRQ